MSDHIIRFEVQGQPVPWARARRNGGRYFPAPEVVTHRDAIQAAWMAAGRPRADDGDPLSIALTFYLRRPPSHYRTGRNAHLLRDDAPTHPTCKPDIDNLSKLVFDALNKLLYRDDAQIVCVAAAGKHWADPDPPRTIVQAWVPSSMALSSLTSASPRSVLREGSLRPSQLRLNASTHVGAFVVSGRTGRNLAAAEQVLPP